VGVTSNTSFTRDEDGHFCRLPAYFNVLPKILNAAQPFNLDFVSQDLDSKVDYFTTRGSGFQLEAIHRFLLCITPYRPLVWSSYILTPKFLADKKCILNVKNYSDQTAIHEPECNMEHISHYLIYEHELNVEELKFPMDTKHISNSRT